MLFSKPLFNGHARNMNGLCITISKISVSAFRNMRKEFLKKSLHSFHSFRFFLKNADLSIDDYALVLAAKIHCFWSSIKPAIFVNGDACFFSVNNFLARKS